MYNHLGSIMSDKSTVEPSTVEQFDALIEKSRSELALIPVSLPDLAEAEAKVAEAKAELNGLSSTTRNLGKLLTGRLGKEREDVTEHLAVCEAYVVELKKKDLSRQQARDRKYAEISELGARRGALIEANRNAAQARIVEAGGPEASTLRELDATSKELTRQLGELEPVGRALKDARTGAKRAVVRKRKDEAEEASRRNAYSSSSPSYGGFNAGGVNVGGVDFGGLNVGGIDLGGGLSVGGLNVGGLSMGGMSYGGVSTGGVSFDSYSSSVRADDFGFDEDRSSLSMPGFVSSECSASSTALDRAASTLRGASVDQESPAVRQLSDAITEAKRSVSGLGTFTSETQLMDAVKANVKASAVHATIVEALKKASADCAVQRTALIDSEVSRHEGLSDVPSKESSTVRLQRPVKGPENPGQSAAR